MLFSDPIIGNNDYGQFYCYALKGDDDVEYSFFAPLKVHNELVNKDRGTKIQLTKTATQKGKKLIQDYEIMFLDNGKEEKQQSKSNGNYYFDEMKKSFEEATTLQKSYNGLNLNSVALSLFISRTKQSNGNTIKELVQ